MNTKEETLALADIIKLRELEAAAYRENNKLALAIYEILDRQLNDLLDLVESKNNTLYHKQNRIDDLKTEVEDLNNKIRNLARRFV